jgi:uncharacterized membrane protein YesL
MFLMVGANLLWALLAIPVVTLFPATMGVYYLTYEKANGRRVEFDYFWQGFREYFGKAWALGAINTVVTVLLVVNIMFYAQQPNVLFYLTIVWIYALILWAGVLIYIFPLALRQEEKRVTLIYRNAVLLAASRPLFTLVVVVMLLLLLAVSVVLSPLLILVYVPLSALICNHALISAIEDVQRRQKELGQKKGKEKRPQGDGQEGKGSG